jgi:hypothetical protein
MNQEYDYTLLLQQIKDLQGRQLPILESMMQSIHALTDEVHTMNQRHAENFPLPRRKQRIRTSMIKTHERSIP